MNVHSDPQPVMIIFQNYFSPSRHAVFEVLGKHCSLLVYYMQSASDEGRMWAEETPENYQAIRVTTARIGTLVVPLGRLYLPEHVDLSLVLDNNPTNIIMLYFCRRIRAVSRSTFLWVEHIPDPSKAWAKNLYQRLTSRALLYYCDGAASFSAMSDKYLASLNFNGICKRVPQVTASPRPNADRRTIGFLRTFGFLGSGIPRKNLAALRQAIATLTSKELSLHIAGCEASETLEREVHHGYVNGSRLEDFFDSIDVLVLPSIVDPWGLVVNEALLRERLVIVSRNCGSAELIYQIDPKLVCGITPDEISQAIEYAMSLSPSEVKLRLTRSSEIMKHFTLQEAAGAFINLQASSHFSISNSAQVDLASLD